MIIHFILERETKGAVRYMETVDSVSDVPKDIASGAVIGTLYIRKSALAGKIPTRIKVTIE